jgi:hypothetical protein
MCRLYPQYLLSKQSLNQIHLPETKAVGYERMFRVNQNISTALSKHLDGTAKTETKTNWTTRKLTAAPRVTISEVYIALNRLKIPVFLPFRVELMIRSITEQRGIVMVETVKREPLKLACGQGKSTKRRAPDVPA